MARRKSPKKNGRRGQARVTSRSPKPKPAASARPRARRSGSKARQAPRRARAKRSRYQAARRFAHYVVEASSVLFLVALGVAAGSYAIVQSLPSTDGIWRTARSPIASVVDATGAPFPVNGRFEAPPVALSDVSPHLVNAVVAIEDRTFFHHAGVNPIAIGRAFAVNTRNGEVRQGGSTISQQLAKNLFLSPERTLKRKIQELYLAFWLEARFTKDEILTLYLNRAYFGAGAYGIAAASRRYFDVAPGDLTVRQSAMLAGLLKAPSNYAPHRHPAAAAARADLVIDAMTRAGQLSRRDAAAARAPVGLVAQTRVAAPYFVDWLAVEASAAVGGRRGLNVVSTLDARLQVAAANGLAAAFDDLNDPALEAAIVILDADGAVRAMVGGRDYRRSQFNRAADARRQPGSAFKPFIYLAALEAGAPAGMRLSDAPFAIGRWAPDNYKGQYFGDVDLRTALARSLNSASISLQERTGRARVRDAALRMGHPGPLTVGPAIGLGVDEVTPLSLAAAYAPLANGGYRVVPYGFTRLSGPRGDVISVGSPQLEVATSAAAIASLNDLLRTAVSDGTGRAAAIDGVAVAGKTGTSQNGRDGWFVGHAGGLVAAVWVGRDDDQPVRGLTGGGLPAEIWREAMVRALHARGAVSFAPLTMDTTPSRRRMQ